MKKSIILTAISASLLFFSCKKNDNDNKEGTFYGTAKTLGTGFVRSYVTLNNMGTPTSLGFNFSETMLSGLPSTVSMSNMVMLDLPAQAANSGYEHLEIDWNPNGHEPLPIYGFPHFDFHFFLVGMSELSTVTGGPDMMPVLPQFIPKDYSSGIMAVPNMGVHWADSLSTEYHGALFTHTFIYGFYKSKMLFLEPMITKSFLDSKTNITLPVKQPADFQKAGYYPANYQIHYDPSKHEFNISLENFTKHG